MKSGRLTNLTVSRAKEPGRYSDGGNLYLLVKPGGAKVWTFRFKLPGGKAREMMLGSERDISLVGARDLAHANRALLRQGRDPIDARRESKAISEGEAQTFSQVASLYIEAHQDGWRNAKHHEQWTTTLATYAHPRIGDLAIGKVTVADVLEVLQPIWKTKSETASRLRGRIEAVLDYGAARGWRSGENPARWKGHLANLLPPRNKISKVQHHAALPWNEAPVFMKELSSQRGTAALALQFTILTAARTSEVTGATWGEIDLEGRTWTVPGDRMKAGVEHRVPLTAAALAVLGQWHTPDSKLSDHVFPGARRGVGLSNMAMMATLRRMKRGDLTVHGFRSTFRDWAAETNPAPREVAEAALAHTLRDKVEAAYRRGDLFERRARLMSDWAEFLAGAAVDATVTPIGQSAPVLRSFARATT